MPEKEDLFCVLERNFLTYKELVSVAQSDNGDPMVSLLDSGVRFSCDGSAIEPSTNGEIFVRRGVVEKLKLAQQKVDDLLPGYLIEVTYGYRSPAVQQRNYEQIRENILSRSDREWLEDDLKEEAHRFIAVPEVAGHPTGGAVDVRLVNAAGEELDMGSPIHEFTKESYTFYPFISKAAWRSRQALRQAMLWAGFAPFDGEWWHFSYGDREWAVYYNKPSSIYKQIQFLQDVESSDDV